MKKLLLFVMAVFLLAGCMKSAKPASTPSDKGGNFSDEMKIARSADLDPEGGADAAERSADHAGSYFSSIDFYNAVSTDSLTILPHFKTMQQTSEWSCGVVSAMLVMNHYNLLGDHTEKSLAEMRTNGLEADATSLASMVKIFETVGGFKLESSFDYSAEELSEAFPLERFQELLKEGTPIMVAWNDWGGHWQAVIGYDTMNTETTADDVIIVADPYDTTDHNQDGYMVYGAERFYYNWTMYDFFEERGIENERDMMFLIAEPIQ